MTPEDVVQAIISLSETMTRPVYRGRSDFEWPPESGAVRRLRDAYGDDFPSNELELRKLVEGYHKDQLIIPMQVIDGTDLDDLPRLSVLQHQGAATGLLDFTEYLLAALWFACKELPGKDARIFILDIGNPQVALNSRSLKNPFEAGQKTVYYEPNRSLGARIIAQRSVFVICNPLIPDQHLKSVVVPKESKEPLQHYLKRLGLSQSALFGDIPGLAEANTTRTLLQRTGLLSPEQYRNRGNRAYQAGRYDDALAAYESYAEVLPDVAEPHCLKGDVLTALGRFADADLAYTKAMENLHSPIFIDQNTVVDHALIDHGLVNWMRCALYYNRGNVRAVIGNHSGAIEDFDIALENSLIPKRSILKNRGNSKFSLRMFVEAYQDFETANLEIEGSDTALAMGNCKIMMGKFEDARRAYLAGTTIESGASAAHCQANAEQAHQILDILDGHDFQIRHEGVIMFVETSHIRGHPSPFSFAGNQGNTGNIPSGLVSASGGEGYEGMNGFAVVIIPATA